MNRLTIPGAIAEAPMGGIASMTHPQPPQMAAPAMEMAPAVASGVATQYWIELLAYPPGSMASLWLLVNNSWKHLDNPSAIQNDAVQRAFLGSGSTVRVWFDGTKIVGLVVNG